MGLGMEQYIAGRFHREQKQIGCIQTDDFIIKDELSACSPDGYVRTLENLKIEMKILQAEKKKVECEEMEARNKVMHAIGDAIALIGTDYKAKFDSRMSLRFSKVK
jgi:hypothetical protein